MLTSMSSWLGLLSLANEPWQHSCSKAQTSFTKCRYRVGSSHAKRDKGWRGMSSFTAESIPKKPPARIDYVVMTVDMTQSYSLALLDQALQSMQDRFLTNKTAIVVTKSKAFGRINTQGKSDSSKQWINVVDGSLRWSECRKRQHRYSKCMCFMSISW